MGVRATRRGGSQRGHLRELFARRRLALQIRAPPPDIVARTERWRALASKHGVPLPAVAIAFACAPRVVKGCAVGVKSPEEVAQSVAWLADANAVPAQLWVDAKELGLLAPDVPTPSPA